MFFLRRPDEARIRAVIEEQARLPFTYPEVGGTRHQAPPGYPLNHHRGRLGSGETAFLRGVDEVRRWTMYRMPWTVLCWPDAPIRPGSTVGVLVRHFGFWSLNPARIVYVLDDENDEVRRFGFAFGTLPEHGETGEERFTIEWHRADDSVWYEIYTFARARHPLVRIGRPLLRYQQWRFGRQSVREMQRAVRAGG